MSDRATDLLLGHRRWLALGRLLGTMLLFACLGPIVGGMFLTPILVFAQEGLQDLAKIGLGLVFYFIVLPISLPVSFVFGAPAAILAAIFVFALDCQFPLVGRRIWLAAVPGVVATAVWVVFGTAHFLDPNTPIANQMPAYFAIVCCGAVTAVVCARLARKWGSLQGRIRSRTVGPSPSSGVDGGIKSP